MEKILNQKKNGFFQIKRKDWILNALYTMGVSKLIDSYFDISYNKTERLSQFKKTGFVLLPKHQRNLDIFLESMLLRKSIGRSANYIMRSSLPEWLEYLGGIPIIRKRDLVKKDYLNSDNKARERKRKEIEKAKKIRDKVYDTISNLLARDEIVIIHPEKTFHYKKDGLLDRPTLKRLTELQKKLTNYIPFVPLSIEYKQKRKFRSKINLTVGKPINTNNLEELVKHLKKEMNLVY